MQLETIWKLLISPQRMQLLFNHTHLNGFLSRTTWVSWYQKAKTSLDLNDARNGGVLRCSSFSWTICSCKQSAPRCRQITTPTPHHSIFTGRMLFLMPNQQCQSTEGKSTENAEMRRLRGKFANWFVWKLVIKVVHVDFRVDSVLNWC